MNGTQLAGRTLTCEHSGKAPRQDRPESREYSSRQRREYEDRGDRRPPPRREDDFRSDPRGNFSGGGGNSRNPNSSEEATKNLFVANIPEHFSEADVMDHFSKCGPPRHI